MKIKTVVVSLILIMLAGIAVASGETSEAIYGDCTDGNTIGMDWGTAWGFNWYLDEHGAWLPLETTTGHSSITAPTYLQSPIKIREDMPTKVYTQPYSSRSRR